MDVYDKEKQKEHNPSLVPSDDDLRKITGTGASEEGVMDREGREGAARDLLNKEQGFFNPNDRAAKTSESDSAGALGNKEAAAGEQAKLAEEGSSRGRNFIQKIKEKKKQAIFGGGALGTILGAGFLVTSVASGPFQLIHAGQLLQGFHMGRSESFGNDRSAKLLLYTLAGKSAQGRLGFIKQRNANTWEKRLNEKSGLRSVYSNDRLQRLIGYEVIDANKATVYTGDAARNGINTNSTFSGVDINGNPITVTGTDLRDTSASTRRTATRIAVRSVQLDRVSSHLGSRVLFKRALIDFHPLKNVYRRGTEKLIDYRKRVQDDRATRNETGRHDVSPQRDENSPSADREKADSKLKEFAKTAAGPVIAVAVLCTARDLSSGAEQAHKDNAEIRQRLGMGIVTASSQVMANNDDNLDEVGAVVDTLYDEETNSTFTDDNGIKHELGEEPNGVDYVPEDAKPGELWPVFGLVGKITTPLAPACEAINWVSGLPVVKQVGEAASAIMKTGADVILLPFDTNVDRLVENANDYIVGSTPNLLAQGAELGGLANIGFREVVDNQMIAMGGTELTTQEANETIVTARAEQDYNFNQSTAYDKYLNLYNSRSMAATIMADMPINRSQLVASITKLPGWFATSTSRLLGVGKVKAALPPYEYTFALHGFTTAEMNNPAYDSPYENEDLMLADNAALLNRMNDEYGTDCFDMQISPTGDLLYGEAKDSSTIPDKCQDRSNADLTRYRFYIADVIAATSLDCYEGAAESCAQIYGGKTETPATPTPTTPGGPIVIGDTSNLTCAAGTDAGVGDGYAEGTLYKTRLCEVQGITVNSQIASNVNNLINTARAAGVDYGGSAFRTMQGQIDARKTNGCPDIYDAPSNACNPNTARPGYSNHQMGLAIDFTQGGDLLNEQSSGFTWLKANAAQYGLQVLGNGSEAWHWSYNGN